MSRTSFIEHKGQRILRMDFSNLRDPADIVKHIGEAKAIVAQQPKNSLKVLLLVNGSTFNREVSRAIQDLAEHDKPYVIASAIVGVEGLMSMLLKTIARVTGRSFRLFNAQAMAKDWLVEQT